MEIAAACRVGTCRILRVERFERDEVAVRRPNALAAGQTAARFLVNARHWKLGIHELSRFPLFSLHTYTRTIRCTP